MAGSGVQIGQNVRIVYNDPGPQVIRSLGVTSKTVSSSEWIIPGYFYPFRTLSCTDLIYLLSNLLVELACLLTC